MDNVALVQCCRCGNVGVHLRGPPKEFFLVPEDPSRATTNMMISASTRLGCADLVSAFHRVPELVRATEHATESAAVKWRCYECRICHMEVVYACRHNISRGSADASIHSSSCGDVAAAAAAAQEEILSEGILVNLELLDHASLVMDEKGRYSHAFKVVLPHTVLRRSTDISKLLGAAGITGLKLFERLTNEVDDWLAQHLRHLTQTDPGCVIKEQEQSLRKQALCERDAIFAKVCQENGIGSDLVSLARAAETLASVISKGLFSDDNNDLDEDYDFEGRCKDLIEFKERHGHCRVPRGWRENVELSNWVRNLRRKKIRGTLSSEKIAKLEELGFVWRKERKDSWEEHFLQLTAFNKRFGHCRVSRNWKENVKLGQWVQSLRRLKLSGRLSADKIARLERIGFEWRLRQKEDGFSSESREGEAYDGESDPGVASSGSDFDDDDDDDADDDENEDELNSEVEEDHQSSWLQSETKKQRWHNIDPTLAKDHSLRDLFAFHDGLRAPPSTAVTAAATTTTTTSTVTTLTKLSPAALRTVSKKSKARLPSAPTFSLNDIDEDFHSYAHFGHVDKHGYPDEDDDDEDAEFDAVLDDDEEDDDDDDWAGIKTTSSRPSKRKRAIDKKLKTRHRHGTDQLSSSLSKTKTGVRACMECGTTKTPHWRRGPSDEHGGPGFLCNACGLRYYKTLQQKSSAKNNRKRSSPKKQKTQDQTATPPARPETTADKKKTTTTATKPTAAAAAAAATATEAVTDSDSEGKEIVIAADHPLPAEETGLRGGAEHHAFVKEDATGHHQYLLLPQEHQARIQAAGAENAHVPWLLALKQKKRKDLQTSVAPPASNNQPMTTTTTTTTTTTSTTNEGSPSPAAAAAVAAAAAKEEDEEIFDFVE